MATNLFGEEKRVIEEEQTERVKKVGLFDFINDLGNGKQYLFNDDTKSAYNPFMVNRAFMQNLDTILLANEMNKAGSISKLMHHDFLFYSVEQKKRFGKWAKKENYDNEQLVEYIMKRYTVGEETAIEYIKMMDDATISTLENNINNKGGRQ